MGTPADSVGGASMPVAATPRQAITAIAILIPVVIGYYVLGGMLGLTALYMGFLFATYWGAVRSLDRADYFPTLCGGLVGIAIAYLLYALPLAIGTPGLILALVATLVPLYLMMLRKARLFLNPAFIVFLTVATIPALASGHDHLGMVLGLVFGAAYARGIVALLALLGGLRRPRPVGAATATGEV